MREPALRLYADEMIVDNFAGGGGASTGIYAATGRHPDIAVNHDPEALALYRANHPTTRVMCEDVFDVVPRFVVGHRKVGLAWFSPDCTFFSKARGAKPFRDKAKARRRRGLAGVALRWAEQVRPRVVLIENVEEFKDWGPLGDDGRPDPKKKGINFQRYVARWKNLGYQIEWRELRACDFGAPTTRKRLFIQARCDGEAIVWPQPTHAPRDKAPKLGLKPYRTAAECIDWSVPCPSIFDRKKPLAEATLRRIARGIMKYVVNASEPFVVPLTHQGGDRVHSAAEPFRTITGANRGEMAVVAPTLVQMCWGERPGQAPRCLDLHAPIGTIMAEGNKHGLVTAFLAKHFGGEHASGKPKCFGSTPLGEPMDTVTSTDHHSLVAAHIVKLKGTCRDGQPMTEPLATVQAQGLHYAEVRAFLVKFYGTGVAQDGLEPLDTITTKDRFAVVVTIHGVDYAIVDIGMRMLTPRELYNAQGFPSDYNIEIDIEREDARGRRRKVALSKTAQVHKCGNSVPPPFSDALVRAAFGQAAAEQKKESVA